MNPINFKNKKILVMGLGALGGGIATTKWLVKHGAKVTVTDLRLWKQLKDSIKRLGSAAKKVKFVLGEHREADFKNNDIIVVNPAVPRESKYLAIARKYKKSLVNDARLFFDTVGNPIVAVTGTRGKTTTTNWIAHFLKSKYPQVVAAGNSSDVALLALTEKLKIKKNPAVVELSSWQLELLPPHLPRRCGGVPGARRAPDIAVITNVYPDHLNRYKSIKDYALAKANIFNGQRRNQKLILNADNSWTGFFLKQSAGRRTNSDTFLFSKKPLPKNRNGIFIKNHSVYFKNGKWPEKVISERILREFYFRGEHNVENLLASLLASHLLGLDWAVLAKKIATLPDILYREEIIIKKKNLIVVNDSTGTSPDAVIAAIKRFAPNGGMILITGGTDKNLDFGDLAKAIKKYLKPNRVYFLNGSATKKMVAALGKIGCFRKEKPQVFENLTEILLFVEAGIDPKKRTTVVFSPGAASFEKFKNEFDRGEKFNLFSKQILGKK
ncbi:UDP-N-acetylmuramoyl-L-alanine--D-glutamate ligase [bacterium]|nr:MAG: UDP-N-acetylmuramoyl-L-alanine--D-glutamate ligase [bacterium]